MHFIVVYEEGMLLYFQGPVLFEKEFPCVGEITYGHYNPLNITASESPLPGVGTDDLYELGDMSGKYGTLENKTYQREYYNDTHLPLWGPTSILGRSVVVHKKEKNERLVDLYIHNEKH